MNYRRFRNLTESLAEKKANEGMSFAEALDALEFDETEEVVEDCVEKSIEEDIDIPETEEETAEEPVTEVAEVEDTELTPAELLSTAFGYKGYQLVPTARDGEEIVILTKQDPTGLLDCAVEELDLGDLEAVIAYIDKQPESEAEVEDAE